MHSEQNPQKQQNGVNGSIRRKVRSLLGLSESGTGRLHGQAQLPPGAFRYLRQSGLQDHFTPTPMSEQQNAPNMMDREEQTPQVMTRDDSQQIDSQTVDDAQSLPQPLAQGGGRLKTLTAATQAHQLSNEKTGQHVQRRHSASILHDQIPVKPVADGTEEPWHPLPDSRPTASGNKEKGQGNRQEMTIPGRSTVRHVYTTPQASVDRENLPVPDQPPSIAQHTAPLPVGQAGMVHTAAIEQGERSAHPPTADRIRPAARPLPAAGQAKDLATRKTTTVTMTAAQATSPVAEPKNNLRRSAADKIVEHADKAETPATSQELNKIITPRQPREQLPIHQGHPGDKERPAHVTPAQRPDVGARQIEELRQTFYELVTKKNMTTGTKDPEQSTTAENQPPPQPPLQQIVVINRASGSRGRGREPYAFWERSGMARTTLKMIR
jgi:hypothetical protein